MISSTTLDYYQTVNSLIHSLDPRVKLISAIGLILSNLLLPDGAWVLFGITWGVIIGLTLIAHVKPIFIIKRSLIAIPFTLVAITLIFTVPGEKFIQFNFFSSQLMITIQGLVRFISIVIRAWLSVQATVLLTATTSFPDLAHALRHLRVPLLLIAILSFMYRYLFVLIAEAQRLLQARAARSATLPGSKKPSLLWNAKIAGNMVGQLFLRSYERSDRVYNAMVARGFTGNFLTYNPHTMQSKDWGALMLFIVILLAIQLSSTLI